MESLLNNGGLWLSFVAGFIIQVKEMQRGITVIYKRFLTTIAFNDASHIKTRYMPDWVTGHFGIAYTWNFSGAGPLFFIVIDTEIIWMSILKRIKSDEFLWRNVYVLSTIK